jgi:thioredoxin 1
MKNTWKIAIVVVLAAAVAATFALRGAKRAEYTPVASSGNAPAAQTTAPPGASPRPTATAAKPRLLELGSMRCQACLEMAKVLDALRASQGEKLRVDFIDVFEQPDAPERYKISVIPTQILYDGAGKEIFRHTGYFSHDDILAKYRELGVGL